jgi:hypothetical protein
VPSQSARSNDCNVHQAQRASPLRDHPRFVGRTVIDDNDFERRKVCRCSDSIERSSPEPPLKVGMITLTEALPAGTLLRRPRTPNKDNETSDSV